MGRFSPPLSPFSYFSPKHIQTHQNTFKHFRFSSFLNNLQGSVLAPNLPLLNSIAWIWGLGVWMPHPFLFIAFPCFFLVIKCFIYFFLACFSFLACFIAFLACLLAFCHDLSLWYCWPSLLGLGYIYFSCLCLDPHVFRLLAMFMLRSTCLCFLYHVYA